MAAFNYCDIEKWKRPLDFWSFCISHATVKVKDINDLLVTAPNALKKAINNIKNKFGGQYEKISDLALKERIEKRKAELDILLALEQELI